MSTNNTGIYQRTYSVLVENEPGVLSRISGLFSARGFNIISLSVGETKDPSMSRMTIVVEGKPVVLEQVNKQLNKLIPVISVLNLKEDEIIAEELILVKLEVGEGARKAVKKMQEEGKLVSFASQGESYDVVRIIAHREDSKAILESLREFQVIEVCRTGLVALSKDRTFGFLEKKILNKTVS